MKETEQIYVDKVEKYTASPCNVRNFYGGRKPRQSLPKCRKSLKDINADFRFKKDDEKCKTSERDTLGEENIFLSGSAETDLKCDVDQHESVPSKRAFYHRNDVFWTTDLYGKKQKSKNFDKACTSPINFSRRIVKHNLNEEKSSISVASQTSFSSSQESSRSSPFSSFRVSPFISTTSESPLMFSSSPTTSDTCDTNLNVVGAQFKTEDPLVGKLQPMQQDILDASLNTSDTSVQSDIVNKRTPPHNTILNYFSKTEPARKSKKPKSIASCMQRKEKTSICHQLRLTGEKITSDSQDTASDPNIMFDLPLSPRQNSFFKKQFNNKKTVSDKLKPQKKEQTYIDIGQKDFGHITCSTCGMVYTKSQEDDEAQHARYHQKIVQKLKFNGWKKERVLQEYHDGRIILIKSSDHHLHLKKLAEVKDIVDSELGFLKCQDLHPKNEQQAFLFISSSKKVVGCAIALPIQKAYPVIISEDAKVEEVAQGVPTLSWCCSTNPVSAMCGISRIWVFSQNRCQGIATRLVDCIRHNFLYGCVIGKHKIAFSDPTPNGRVFAEKYTGQKEILVFR